MDRESNKNLYQRLVEITGEYLGPASSRFIDRQIVNHLNKDPQKVSKNDLPTLNKWLYASMALLTEDEEMLNEYSERLNNLSNSNNHITA